MKAFLIEIIFAAVASVICVVYIVNPVPFLMFLFVFVAQPMFLYAMGSTAFTIYKDLRKNKVI